MIHDVDAFLNRDKAIFVNDGYRFLGILTDHKWDFADDNVAVSKLALNDWGLQLPMYLYTNDRQ